MQSKKESLIEALINVGIGFLISLVASFIIYPLLGIPVTVTENLVIVMWFTAISIARSYIIRRYFNRKKHG